MRLRFIVATAAAVLWLAGSALADEVDVRDNVFGDGVEYGGGRNTGDAQHSGGAAAGGAHAPVYRASFPYLGFDSQGETCVTTESRTFSTPEAAAAFDAAQEPRWLTLVGQFPLCPGVTLPVANPVTFALAFWGEIPLPRPEPHIEPGFAVTGKLAYLETSDTLHRTFTRDTPLGPITLQATGEYVVSWGDGSTGTYAYPGGAWPSGRITHGYVDTGTVDVVVGERWSATWSLAGQSGTLTGLRTEGRIDDMPVYDIQAVRNR